MQSPTLSIFEDLPPIEETNNCLSNASDSDRSIDSLFDESPVSATPKSSRIPRHSRKEISQKHPASRHLQDGLVPGLIYNPSILIPPDLETQIISECLKTWFTRHRHEETPSPQYDILSHLQDGDWEFNDVNQVMLFNRTDGITSVSHNPSWPLCITTLLIHISHLLAPPVLDPRIWDLLFSSANLGSEEDAGTRSRQAIVNLYHPGEGISDHVDLLDRYDDGIIGVSFGTGCVMRFKEVTGEGENTGGYGAQSKQSEESQFVQLYLPPRSIVVMTRDARYQWTHGIPGRVSDFVDSCTKVEEGVWVERGMRLSVTFRWLLAGADVVGSK